MKCPVLIQSADLLILSAIRVEYAGLYSVVKDKTADQHSALDQQNQNVQFGTYLS